MFSIQNPVFKDYRENIIVDKNNPILAFKANRDRYTEAKSQVNYAGLPQLGSIYSEDALTWNVFRMLDENCLLDVLNPHLDITPNPKMLLWTLAFTDAASELQYKVGEIIRRVDGKFKGQITEPDIIILSSNKIYVIECKLGRANEYPKHLWQSSAK